MNKIQKFLKTKVGIITAILLAVVLLIYILPSNEKIAKDPEKIADLADFDLPAFTVTDCSDNEERDASAWSSVYYDLLLNEPLSEESINHLNGLVEKYDYWTFDQENKEYVCYKQNPMDDEDPVIQITVSVATRKVQIGFFWWDMLA